MGPLSSFAGTEIMRILFVEDHIDFGQHISGLLRESGAGVQVVLVRSRDAAFREIAHDFFDLIILDLTIPPADDDLNAEREHGQAVFYEARKACPGTPIFLLTGSEMDSFSKGLARFGEQVDLWGDREESPTLSYYEKESVDDLLHEVTRMASKVSEIRRVRLNYRGRNLGFGPGEERCLRIVARRQGAVSVDLEPLGGLSAARVVRTTFQNAVGQVVCAAVAKLGSADHVAKEIRGYEDHGRRLPMGAFAPRIDTVEKGAWGKAAAIYSLAEDFDRSLFKVVVDSPEVAADVVRELRSRLEIWVGASQTRSVTIGDVRRRVLWDESFQDVVRTHQIDEKELLGIESREVLIRECCIHGDLHGGNVLVNGEGRPVLIDFGDVGPGSGCIDPVTLELSCAFHPDAAELGLLDALAPRLHRWADRDAYEVSHPHAPFVNQCREWAHDCAGSDLAFLASAYAYVLRQLRFVTTNAGVARNLLAHILDAIRAQP